MKVVLITEIVSPYRIPVFNEIAKNDQIDFKVLLLSEGVPDRSWRIQKEKIKFQYQILGGIRIPLPNRFPIFFNPRIYSWLKAENPDLIICGGYHHPSDLLALRYAKKYGKRFILWCESHDGSVGLKGFPFNLYRNYFIHSSDAFLVPGKKSFKFIRGFGINGKTICVAPNAVDNNLFSCPPDQIHLQKLRNKFPHHVILYVGRLVDLKGILTLLEAFRDVSMVVEGGLVLVGEGKDRQKYQDFCSRSALKNVFFEGFKQQEELPYYYKTADLFVLPSYREEWGLVLNEAAASGLPLIATDASGAAFDLIDESKNGYRVPTGNVQALRAAILKILTDPGLKKSMGVYSRKKADEFSPKKCAEGFLQAIFDRGNGS